MAQEALREIIDALHVRLQAELDGQIRAVEAAQQEALVRARQEAEAEVEKRWASKLDAVRSEWSARLQSEVSSARDEAEKRLVSESMRVRTEAEQALAAERQRAAGELEAERQRAEQELHQTLATLDAERRELELEEEAFRRSADVDASTIVGATRAIGDARSLSDALSSLTRAAAAHAPRVALFIVNGARLDEWPVDGVQSMSPEPISLAPGGLLHAAVSRGTMVLTNARNPEASPPAFASLQPGAAAVAVPLMVGDRAVAVLYADGGVSPAGEGNRWVDAVELLVRHAAACLAHLTAVRSLQLLSDGNGHPPEHETRPDDERSARRYAKLLVSEIKLYNEGAVRVGCEKGDLLHRLKAEIERARRLYEERVPASVTDRGTYFHQELVHTLAGGDATALGRPQG